MADALPQPCDLTGEQVRGAACVWCAAGLRPGVGDFDLGARRDDLLGATWFPRSCRSCHAARAWASRHTEEAR
nr:hypothetical protein [Streptomyces sp. TverLS-915]